MRAVVSVDVDIEYARTTISIAGYDVKDKTDEEICKMAIKMNDCYAVDTKRICVVDEKQRDLEMIKVRRTDMQRLVNANNLEQKAVSTDDGFMLSEIENAETVMIIPDHPTNGDIQKEILTDFAFENLGDTVIGERFEPYCHLQFSKEWWDTPYKQMTKDEREKLEEEKEL